MRFFEFNQNNKKPLTEGARIEHLEDLVFRELPPSKGANRALQSLINMEKGGHTDRQCAQNSSYLLFPRLALRKHRYHSNVYRI